MSDKAIFLDRDNTIIDDPGYINHPDQVKLLDGAAQALVQLKAMGYKLIVVSNQSGVARGIVTEKTLSEIHDRLKQLLAENGAYLDGIYYCPYHPEGSIAKYRRQSDLQKPKPGMLLKAANEMDIDLSLSWMIGDSARDIEAGHQAGCRTILIEKYQHFEPNRPNRTAPDYKAVNMKEAVNIIKKHRHQPKQNSTPVTVEEPIQPIHNKTQNNPAREHTAFKGIEQLLHNIHSELKSIQRAGMFSDFSIMRLMAGTIQVVVFFCLLISIWFLLGHNKQNDSVLIALGFALVLQVMALTFYIMQNRK